MLTPIVARLADLGGPIDRLNQADVLHTPAGATAGQLAQVLDGLVARHDALRLQLDRPVPALWSLQVRAEHPGVTLRRIDATGLDDDALRDLVGTESDAAADRLAPERGDLLAAVWLDRGADTGGLLVLVIHHLAVDGVSWQILRDDLAQAWTDVCAGRRPALPAVAVSVREYAARVTENAQQAARLGEFEHWSATLAPGAELDGDADLTGLTVGATREHTVTLTPAQTAPLLGALPAAHGVDLTELLLAALGVGVGRWRLGQHRPAAPLLVDLERHGRAGPPGADLDLSRTVGWFTAVAPVRLPALDADPATDPGAALAAVSAAVRSTPGTTGRCRWRRCDPGS